MRSAPKLLDGLADIGGRSPLAGVDGRMQARLAGFTENAVEGIGRELRLIAGQIDADDPGAHAFGSQPGNLLGQLGALVAIDRGYEANNHVELDGSGLRGGSDPVHDLIQRKAFGTAEGHGRETQFHVADVVLGCVFHGLAGDAVDDFRRSIEQAQGIELGQEIAEREVLVLLHLNEVAEPDDVLRNGNVVRPGNIQHGVEAQRSLQMPMQLDLGKAAKTVQGGSDAF